MTFVPDDHPEARDEYVDAVDYYDERRAGLGSELIDRFEDAIQDVITDPTAWPRVQNWDGEPILYSRGVKTFPYRIVYYVRGDQVRIIAYAHERRRPGYWGHRVAD